jgi:hypothetical protein
MLIYDWYVCVCENNLKVNCRRKGLDNRL